MPLNDNALAALFLGQLIFGSIIVISLAVALKGNLLQLFDRPRGRLALELAAIFFICTITGNLALVSILRPEVVATLFGAVLGYVFGVGLRGKGSGQSGAIAKNLAAKSDSEQHLPPSGTSKT
jgi:hypothetical protein